MDSKVYFACEAILLMEANLRVLKYKFKQWRTDQREALYVLRHYYSVYIFISLVVLKINEETNSFVMRK